MSQRSTIGFKEKYYSEKNQRWECKSICRISNRYNGNLSGVGKNIIEFLKSGKLPNGVITKDMKIFNSIGCLAAQYIAENKNYNNDLRLSLLTDREDINYDIIWYWSRDGRGLDSILILYKKKEYTIEEFENFIIENGDE